MKLLINNKGQTKIIEATIASLIVIGAVAVGSAMVKDISILSLKQKESNERLAYDILTTLIRGNVVEDIIFQPNGNLRSGWEEQMNVIISSLVPPNLFYNFTVYNYTYSVDPGKVLNITGKVQLNKVKISNIGESSSVTNIVSSADVIYTNKKLGVIELHFEIYQP
ncbi:MAG: hypothetical protein HA495_02090 [Thaumarchaeota archaeon]|nr:hypothetical protein [Nitrososphaerota archaeon]